MTITADIPTPRPKAPKTPSPGQFRAVAASLKRATVPSTDPLLSEAHDVVAEWCEHQAAPRSRP